MNPYINPNLIAVTLEQTQLNQPFAAYDTENETIYIVNIGKPMTPGNFNKRQHATLTPLVKKLLNELSVTYNITTQNRITIVVDALRIGFEHIPSYEPNYIINRYHLFVYDKNKGIIDNPNADEAELVELSVQDIRTMDDLFINFVKPIKHMDVLARKALRKQTGQSLMETRIQLKKQLKKDGTYCLCTEDERYIAVQKDRDKPNLFHALTDELETKDACYANLRLLYNTQIGLMKEE